MGDKYIFILNQKQFHKAKNTNSNTFPDSDRIYYNVQRLFTYLNPCGRLCMVSMNHKSHYIMHNAWQHLTFLRCQRWVWVERKSFTTPSTAQHHKTRQNRHRVHDERKRAKESVSNVPVPYDHSTSQKPTKNLTFIPAQGHPSPMRSIRLVSSHPAVNGLDVMSPPSQTQLRVALPIHGCTISACTGDT